MLKINTQLIEKSVHPSTRSYDVHSIFFTIQGEGPFVGQPSIFIRLAGCNLQCPACDTDYTSQRKNYKTDELIAAVTDLLSANNRRPLVVITGGEPFRQNLWDLVQVLFLKRFRVQIETNGTLYQDLPWGTLSIVCSPKTGAINKKLLPHINALKYVLHADSVCKDDGLPLEALGHPNSGKLARPPVGFSGNIYLQPIDDHESGFNSRHLEACIASCLKYGYTLGVQLHKLINLE